MKTKLEIDSNFVKLIISLSLNHSFGSDLFITLFNESFSTLTILDEKEIKFTMVV